ncbi:MAG: YkgJ family cysteine cluster protein [Chitinivibrionales bacterium]|nr:YkgJ family cysteine cluster protein [Chitinivibrionales bacterium]
MKKEHRRMNDEEKRMQHYQKLCKKCTALCCRHVALNIEKPTTKQDYDNIRWYLMHKNVHVSIDHENEWLLEFVTDCEYLGPRNECTNYENRPKVCRDYPEKDTLCVFEADHRPYKKLFTNHKQFERYLEKKGKKWKFKKLK